MIINLLPGTYILAISGGIDSMTLLDIVANNFLNKNYKFVIAHFDHGIREDSNDDRLLVEKTSKMLNIDFEFISAQLPLESSEDFARNKRYQYLRSILNKYSAEAIITAHHQDDLLETAVFNVLRGTGRKGLTSLSDREDIVRPLLKYTKNEIRRYAINHNLVWREDSTNNQLKYQRNIIRHQMIPKFSSDNHRVLINLITNQQIINKELDYLLDNLLKDISSFGIINKVILNQLPKSVINELIATWLRNNRIYDFDRKTIERIVNGSKIGIAGKKYDIKHGYYVLVMRDQLALKHIER